MLACLAGCKQGGLAKSVSAAIGRDVRIIDGFVERTYKG